MENKCLSAYSEREEDITSDLLYLVAKFLEASPCKQSSKVLLEEIRERKLIPDRYDWLGNRHERTLEEWDRLHPHIGGHTLPRLASNLLPLLDRLAPSGVRGVRSLLGAGSCSPLRTTAGGQQHHLTLRRAVARRGGHCLLDPLHLRHLPGLPVSTFGRELQGSCTRRHLVTERLHSRMQLLKRTLGHLSAVYCCLFDRTGFNIITGADDGLVKVWSAIDGRLLATLRGAASEISDLAVCPDNCLLAAGSCDRVIRVWDLLTTAPVAVLCGHGGMITALEFCGGALPQQRFLASTANDGCVAFWSYRRDAAGRFTFDDRPLKINERVRPGQAQLACLAFSAGATFLAIGGADHHVRVYRTTGAEGPERILETEAHADRVDSLHWSHAGCRFLSGSKDGTAIVWRFERQEWTQLKLTMERLPEFREPHDDGRQRPLRVTMVHWSCDDTRVITTVSDTSFRVWEAGSGRLLHVLAAHTDEVYVVEAHPSEPRLVLSAGHDGKLVIWDVHAGTVLASLFNAIEGEGHGGLFDARWSPCGLFVAATDSHGHLIHFGVSGSDKFRRVPYEQFFHTDYRPLMRDARQLVLDEQTQLAPHLLPPPLLVDRDGNPQPAAAQRLVPGRQGQTEQQLMPLLQPVLPAEEAEVDVEGLGPEVRPRRPTIDDMIEQLAVAQALQDSAAAPAGAGGDAAAAPPPQNNPLLRRVVPRLPPRETTRRTELRRELAALEQQQYEAELTRPRRPAPASSGARLTTRERRRQRMLRRRQPDTPQLQQQQPEGEQARVTRAARSARAPFSEDFENPDTLSLGEETPRSSSPASSSEAEGQQEDGSQSSEYSDWLAESGAALNPPQRQPKRLTARQRALRRRRIRSATSDASQEPEPEPDASPEPQPGPSGTQPRRRRGSPAGDRQRAGSAAAAATAEATAGPSAAAARSGRKRAPPPEPRVSADAAAEQLSEPFPPSAWLSEVLPRKTPYFPQMGDELIYFRQGHQLYVEMVRKRKIYDISPRSLPWAKQTLRDRELVKIIGVKYELRPPCLCCLKLGRLDPETGAVIDAGFTIKYHDMPDVVDFLVLRPAYQVAVDRRWKPGDRFRSTIDDAWWTGRVLERRPLDPDSPESPFLCYRVAWDTGETEPLSPWDMEPPDPDRTSDDESSQGSIPLTDAELRGSQCCWQQRADDWAGLDPQDQMERIRRCLEQVMQLAIAEPFLAPVDLNMYPTYALTVEYPIDLSTIKARLENGFYRRITAVQFDVRYLASNTEKFNQPHSNIVRSARLLTDLCLEMIGDSDCHDPSPIYRRIAQQYDAGRHRRDRRLAPEEGRGSATTSARSPRVTRQIARRRFADKTWQELCLEMLDKLERHEDSVHFRQPVDLEAYPDYLQLVEQPIDLCTVREELEACSYVSPQELADDVRLIFHNSKTYNTDKRSPIFAMTLRLSCYFEEQMRPILTFFVSGQRPTRSRRPVLSEEELQSSGAHGGSSRARVPESGRRSGRHRLLSDPESEEEEEVPFRAPLPPVTSRLRGRTAVSYAEEASPATRLAVSGRLRERVPVSYAEHSDAAESPRLAALARPPLFRFGETSRRGAAVAPEQPQQEEDAEQESEDGEQSSSSSSSSSSDSEGEENEEEEDDEAGEDDEDEEQEGAEPVASSSKQPAPRLRKRTARAYYAPQEEDDEIAAPRPSAVAETGYMHDSDWEEARERAVSAGQRRSRRRPVPARQRWTDILDEDDDEDEDVGDADFNPPVPQPGRNGKKKRSRRQAESDDSGNDDDVPRLQRKRARKRQLSSLSEEETPRRRVTTPKKKRRPPEDISDDGDAVPARRTPKKSRRRVAVVASDQDGGSDEPAPARHRSPRRGAGRRRHSSPEEDGQGVHRRGAANGQAEAGTARKSRRPAAALATHLLQVGAHSDESEEEVPSARLARRLAHADATAAAAAPAAAPVRKRSFRSPEEERDGEAPRISVSSRGRLRKLNPHAFTAD